MLVLWCLLNSHIYAIKTSFHLVFSTYLSLNTTMPPYQPAIGEFVG